MKLNRTVLIVVIVGVVLVGLYVLMSGPQPATAPGTALPQTEEVMEEDVMMEEEGAMEESVAIADFAFSPTTIRVKVGGTVTWTNQDSVAHTATADGGSFDTGLLGQGQSGSVTFDTAGSFPYHCTPHPNMKGTVIVE